MNTKCGEKDEQSSSFADLEVTQSLALQWAKKYLQNLDSDFCKQGKEDTISLKEVVSQEGRKNTAKKLMASLRTVSHQAWYKVEILLSQEAKRHKIDPKLLNPWEITDDSFNIYGKTLFI